MENGKSKSFSEKQKLPQSRLAPHGTKEAGGIRFEAKRLGWFLDVYTRFINGFDDHSTFGLRNVTSAGMQHMVPGITSASDPD
jgi:hypothetical protein